MLDYLFRTPNIFQVREARERFIENDEILIAESDYIHLEGGDIWRRRRSRGVARKMHAWFFYYFLRPFHNRADEIIVRKLIELLRSWREIVDLPPTRIPMAYHDEATAQRTIALSCMLADYGHLFSDEDSTLIQQILTESVNLLVDEEFHSHGTNHGMYQDLALIIVSNHIPQGHRYLALGIERLNDYFQHAFTEDGIHNEQSPQYHCIVSGHLREYINFLSDRDSDKALQLQEIFQKTETYATMAISPLGKFPPVSDTVNELVSSLGYTHLYKSPEFLYAVTQGLLGTPPRAKQYVAPKSGVAIYREDWRDPNSVYLYFSAAYNSDYHKHSDELSLYLVHRGVEVLREAGPNGYEMKDPLTVYGFSSFGHNTLIVNNKGLPRTDPDSMDKVGLQTLMAGGEDNLDRSERAIDFRVEGWNHRFAGVQHHRILSFSTPQDQESPKTLTIQDEIASAKTNDYQLLWHFGPEVIAQLDNHTVSIRDCSGVNIATLTVLGDTDIKLSIVSGQTEPCIQGWYFPKMGVCEPTQTLIISFTDDHAAIQTEILLV